MFKRLSNLFGAKPAKKKAEAPAAPRKPAADELQEAADAMGEVAAAMKRAAAEMNQAVTGSPPGAAAKAPEPSAAAVEEAAARLAAQTRQDLIRHAMEVRRDKARALENLPARDQQRLRALAEKMLLGGTGGSEAPPKPGTPPRRQH